MSTTGRHFYRMPLACAALALASGCTTAVDNSGAAYRSWLAARVRSIDAQDTPRGAAVAAALRQHLCGDDTQCFSDADWHALDQRAVQSEDPSVLMLATNVAEHRASETDAAGRWAQIGTLDRDNAYPLIRKAGADWHAGRKDESLETLRTALERPNDDDRFSNTFALMKPVIDAAPPSLAELHPCSLTDDDADAAKASTAELRGSALFEIAADVGFSPHLTDIVAMCRDIAPQETARIDSCQALGEHLAKHSTSQLGRSVGFALKRISARDSGQQQAFAEQQRRDEDELHRKLWLVVRAPRSPQRAEATEYWLDQIARSNEIAAADALIARYGEPPPESREDRERFSDLQMQHGQACYARIRHDHK